MEISAQKTLHGERDYLRVARTLRDKLDGLITSRATDLGTQRNILLEVSQESALVLANNATPRYEEISTCTHSCCEHEQIMNPGLWSTLPMELLQRVFAKLPFPDICRLKSLSKEWQLSLQSSSSEFTLALKESSPGMFARVSSAVHSSFWVHVLDGRNNRWHELLVYVPGSPANRRLRGYLSTLSWVHMNGAADAGLVCYVDKNRSTSFSNCIYVTNPMTGFLNPLPNLNLMLYSELTMMRIVVDPDTFHYKVIVVKSAPSVEAEVYDSEVRQWTKPDPSLGRIFGIAHDWNQSEHSIWSAHETGPCAYDCRDGKYYDFTQDQEKWSVKEVISYTLTKDRLFVLHWEQRENAAFISEYCVSQDPAQDATSWVKEKTHSCFPRFSWQPDPREMTSRIHACSGFLFVFQHGGRLVAEDKKLEIGWVYDLDTCEWRALPRFPFWAASWSRSFLTNMMCELHWNIRP